MTDTQTFTVDFTSGLFKFQMRRLIKKLSKYHPNVQVKVEHIRSIHYRMTLTGPKPASEAFRRDFARFQEH